MGVGELFAAWLFERVLNRAVGGVLGDDAEREAVECFGVAARVAARTAIEGRGDVADEASIDHLTAAFAGMFSVDLLDAGEFAINQMSSPLWEVLREAVAERFRVLDQLPASSGESQASALGIDTDAVGRTFFGALILAMGRRSTLQPLRAALFDEVHTTQLELLLDSHAELQRLIRALVLEMARIGMVVEAWQRQLAEGQEKPDRSFRAPPVPKRPLPDGFEAGRKEEAKLLELVLGAQSSESSSPTVVGLTTALVGAGGFGKTTSAEWLIEQPQVQKHFERILWVEMGIEPNLADVILQAYVELTGHQPAVTSTGQLRTLFAQAVGVRRLLIVVDDVWSHAALQPFLDDAWRAVTVVTTRQRDILPAGVPTVEVDEISDEIARRIAARDLDLGASDVDALLERAKGWPLLLRRLNRDVHFKTHQYGLSVRGAVASVIDEYDLHGPANFDPSDADDRRRAVAASVGIGIRHLRDRQVSGLGELAKAYRMLGVFPADTRIPLGVLQQLYSAHSASRTAVPMQAVHRVCQDLHAQSLVQRFDPVVGWIELHDEIREHLRHAYRNELADAHRMLLDAVRPAEGWGAQPEQPAYWWSQLAWHLIESGQADELGDTVLDPSYLLRKVCVTGPVAIEADLRLAPPTGQVQALERMLSRDGFCLLGFRTAAQAAPTFAARLAGTPQLSGLRAGIEALGATPWLRPERPPPDLPSSALRRTLTSHHGSVWSVAWSPEGGRLASASSDGTVRIWDVGDPEAAPVVLSGHHDLVWSVAWSPGGGRLASASSDGTVRIWDVGDPEADPVVLTGHQGQVRSVAWSPGGERLASASSDRSIRIWNTETLRADPVVLTGHQGQVHSVAWSPAGERIASASWDRSVRVWDTRDPEADLIVFSGHQVQGPVRSVAWSPAGERIASASWDRGIRVWDSEDPGADPVVLSGHEDLVRSVAWSPAGERLASASSDSTVRIWDVGDSEADPVVLMGHRGPVGSVVWSPSGAWLASAGSDGTVRIWDVGDSEADPVVLTGHRTPVRSVAWSPEGHWLASASSGRTVRLWDTGDPEANPVVLTGHKGPVWSVAWSPKGEQLASASSDGTVRIWDVSDVEAEPVVLTGHHGPLRSVAWSPTGDWLASASMDRTVRLWSPQYGEVSRLAGASTLASIAWHPRLNRLVAGGSAGWWILHVR